MSSHLTLSKKFNSATAGTWPLQNGRRQAIIKTYMGGARCGIRRTCAGSTTPVRRKRLCDTGAHIIVTLRYYGCFFFFRNSRQFFVYFSDPGLQLRVLIGNESEFGHVAGRVSSVVEISKFGWKKKYKRTLYNIYYWFIIYQLFSFFFFLHRIVTRYFGGYDSVITIKNVTPNNA